ncbi:uncharacterized protein ALTATR162_LOCUS9781 [Alternaria atra]|uniref:Uncharacterized protein n=1 Tax=Alternaria atra TaxID=119953 RepID=A0A8J2N5P6_9PLEO|nr:uncharacterized protein ALTATR162_LOCUS9781 [Alternaria atra]CAG5181477.1 unnamed protein product [Alternaria atra]
MSLRLQPNCILYLRRGDSKAADSLSLGLSVVASFCRICVHLFPSLKTTTNSQDDDDDSFQACLLAHARRPQRTQVVLVSYLGRRGYATSGW